jgi:hypothetical protein
MNCLRVSVPRCAGGAHRQRRQRLEGRLRKLEPDHRGRLDGRALGTAQAVQPRFEQGVDGRRHRDLGAIVGTHPAPVLQLQHAAVDQHRQHLLGVQRVALRGVDDAPRDLGGQPGRAEQVGHHLRGSIVGQRLQL